MVKLTENDYRLQFVQTVVVVFIVYLMRNWPAD